MTSNPATLIRALTLACLAGLLLSVGLRLTPGQVMRSLRGSRVTAILVLNFAGVPLLVTALVHLFHVRTEVAIGMSLLAAAPFAPVVPTFAKMARADLALAAGWTAVMPILSVVLTPLASECMLRLLPGAEMARIDLPGILLVLTGTITAPLCVGLAIAHYAPGLKDRIVRPVEVLSEATGALSLTVVAVTEVRSILETGWVALLAMLISCETSLALGYYFGGKDRGSRFVAALGTSNRNIALALLLAIQSFGAAGVAPAVAANGLLLIFMGLLHVAVWRWLDDRASHANPKAGADESSKSARE